MREEKDWKRKLTGYRSLDRKRLVSYTRTRSPAVKAQFKLLLIGSHDVTFINRSN
jgi:hypothetical protein